MFQYHHFLCYIFLTKRFSVSVGGVPPYNGILIFRTFEGDENWLEVFRLREEQRLLTVDYRVIDPEVRKIEGSRNWGCLPFTQRNRFVNSFCEWQAAEIPDGKFDSDRIDHLPDQLNNLQFTERA